MVKPSQVLLVRGECAKKSGIPCCHPERSEGSNNLAIRLTRSRLFVDIAPQNDRFKAGPLGRSPGWMVGRALQHPAKPGGTPTVPTMRAAYKSASIVDANVATLEQRRKRPASSHLVPSVRQRPEPAPAEVKVMSPTGNVPRRPKNVPGYGWPAESRPDTMDHTRTMVTQSPRYPPDTFRVRSVSSDAASIGRKLLVSGCVSVPRTMLCRPDSKSAKPTVR